MGITVPSAVVVTPASGLMLPPMGLQGLHNALLQGNYLWRHYAPPLVDDWPSGNDADGPATTAKWITPIKPSADGLTYRCMALLATSLSTTATVTVSYCTTWGGIGSTTWTSMGSATPTTSSSALTTATVDAVIPAGALALLWTVTVASGTFTTHHLLCVPRETSLLGGRKASGFVPYDDGLLAASGNPPVNTELVNRPWANARALAADRWHTAVSFLQPTGETYSGRLRSLSSPTWHTLGIMRVWFGAQRPTLQAHVLATVSGGATADLVQVRQLVSPADPVVDAGAPWSSGLLPADGSLASSSAAQPVRQGTTPAYWADFAVEARSTVGQTTKLHAVRVLGRLL